MTTTLTRTQAACANHPHTDWWLSSVKADQDRAVAICRTCPLLTSCREDAVRRRLTDAVRGGLTGPELRKLAGPARREVRHNRARYISGKCHCATCLAANASYMARWRARRGPVTQQPKMFVELPGGQLALRLEDR